MAKQKKLTLPEYKRLIDVYLLKFPDSDIQVIQTENAFAFELVPKAGEENKIIDPVK